MLHIVDWLLHIDVSGASTGPIFKSQATLLDSWRHVLCNIPEQRRTDLYRGESLQARIRVWFDVSSMFVRNVG